MNIEVNPLDASISQIINYKISNFMRLLRADLVGLMLLDLLFYV